MATNCLITSGITRTCDFSVGGLSVLYLANKSEVSAVSKDSNGQVTGITMVTGATFYDFEYVPQTAQAIESLQVGTISKSVLQTINAQLDNITQIKKNVLQNLVLGDLVAIVRKNADGGYYLFEGGDRGLNAVTGDLDSGTADTDDAGFTLSLAAANRGYADQVDQSIIAGLL